MISLLHGSAADEAAVGRGHALAAPHAEPSADVLSPLVPDPLCARLAKITASSAAPFTLRRRRVAARHRCPAAERA